MRVTLFYSNTQRCVEQTFESITEAAVWLSKPENTVRVCTDQNKTSPLDGKEQPRWVLIDS